MAARPTAPSSLRTRGVQPAISMSETTDRSAPIYASLVKGQGDDSFTLIWSRRNSDWSNWTDAAYRLSGRVDGR
ncbi:hypothetical protein TSA1_07810 [Bradyrhizobium nitroreducens]|uniref:Uncharacterized protein n=2 Tax=Bradyrhizobium nitroreducens TaxID=709803 RepID=A0A2M6U7Y2_9BRAD|nr:hypothetical protein TSA1_07810 [Bradyrhizobium nitroreducens]